MDLAGSLGNSAMLQSLHARGVPQCVYELLKSELPHAKRPIKPADDSSALLALPTQTGLGYPLSQVL